MAASPRTIILFLVFIALFLYLVFSYGATNSGTILYSHTQRHSHSNDEPSASSSSSRRRMRRNRAGDAVEKTGEEGVIIATTATASTKMTTTQTAHIIGGAPAMATTAISATPPPLRWSQVTTRPPNVLLWHMHSPSAYAIIDVGTNADPEFATMARRQPDAFYIGVEPILYTEARQRACLSHHRGGGGGAPMKNRCTIVQAAVFNKGKYAQFHEGKESACSSLLGGGQRCARSRKTRFVQIKTLDEIIDHLPLHVSIYLVALDCQGADFYAIASLRRHRDRVANVILECQDLPLSHKMIIYQEGRARNCGQIIACITKHWGWRFSGCTVNYPAIREFNCYFHNPYHRMFNASVRHTSDSARRVSITHEETCPDASWLETDRK